jgi:protoheme IX farnesyltransferase
VDVHLLHRLLAYTAAWFIGLTIYQLFKSGPLPRALSIAAWALGFFVLLQIVIGAIAVSIGVPPLFQALHVAGASAVWGSLVVLLALLAQPRSTLPGSSGRRSAPAERPGEALPAGVSLQVQAEPAGGSAVSGGRSVASAYFALTKPRVTVLLLITTLASMMVAAGGLPALPLVFTTLFGGALAAGGAGAINHYLDRDIDALMGRTASRPIPNGSVPPRQALIFGIALGILSFVLLAAFVNLLSAALSLGALLFYVFVYTRWLKRTTPSNIVIGGAAGAVPPLVGVAAVTGEINLLALYLFAIVFFWTPPHFWALALLMRGEYERARVPMLPIVRGDEEARRQIVLYSLQLVALTVVMFSFQLMGLFYLVAALLLGGLFIFYAIRLWRRPSAPAARTLFRYSLLYLTLLFTAMVVDRRFVS